MKNLVHSRKLLRNNNSLAFKPHSGFAKKTLLSTKLVSGQQANLFSHKSSFSSFNNNIKKINNNNNYLKAPLFQSKKLSFGIQASCKSFCSNIPKYITEDTPLKPKFVVTRDIEPKLLRELTRSQKDHPLYDHMTPAQKNEVLRGEDERYRNKWPYWLDLPQLEVHLRQKAKKLRILPAVRRGDYGPRVSKFYRKNEWVPAVLQGKVNGKSAPDELLLIRQRYFVSENDRTEGRFADHGEVKFYYLEIDGKHFPVKMTRLEKDTRKKRYLSVNFWRATPEAIQEYQSKLGEDNSIWHPPTHDWITPHANALKMK